MARTYHHGNLRPVLLAAAVEAIEQDGPAALSLRDLARRAGVSHAAPAHHFGDKAGLLTALAAEGYGTHSAHAVNAAGDEIVEAGVAYIRFAIEHRAHFEVMFQPGLYRHDDPEVTAARERQAGPVAGERARGGAQAVGRRGRPGGPARGLVDSARIRRSVDQRRALPAELGSDPAAAARPVIGRLLRLTARSNGSGRTAIPPTSARIRDRCAVNRTLWTVAQRGIFGRVDGCPVGRNARRSWSAPR